MTVTPAFDLCRQAVRACDWNAGLAAWQAALDGGNVPTASARLYHAIACIRSAADPMTAIGALDASFVTDAAARMDVRRLIVMPFVRDSALDAAAEALRVLVQAWPHLADDRRLLASVFGRLKRWDEAIGQADAASLIEPANTAMLAARIQLRLQASLVADAARIARATADALDLADSNAHLWLTALVRNGDGALAGQLASRLDVAVLPNDRVAAMVVQALLSDDRIEAAIVVGERALDAGHEGAALRSSLGQAYLARGNHQDRTEHALCHFARGVELAPKNLRLASLYGETLLRTGKYAESIAPLRAACELAPELEHARAMLARAMRYAGRYDEAADELLTLVRRQPDRVRLQRAAVAALSQSGRKDEASELYESYLKKRADMLPATFAEALLELDKKIESAPIPRARLDWAWSMRREPAEVDRATWERAARWGYLVDDLLLEWIECRESQIEEAMSLLGSLDEAEAFFAPLLASGKGFVVATAHVGPMYAGLMTLELLGIPARWLSTTPSIASASYASALISTADQTEAQVAKECLRALQAGYAVCLAVEGAPNPAAPRISFEGQEVTYSSFASRAAHRLGLPSIFYAPRWHKGEIVPTLEMLPNPLPGEDVEAFALRWQQAYLTHLRDHIAGPAENLRLSGGIWRHVRRVDRSHSANAADDAAGSDSRAAHPGDTTETSDQTI
ncbi:Vi polysaccharide transport protein VexE [Caballeronia sp. EK]|nr:Vi polysaccharide transport protein VexE [Caballeronia sp. EK]